MSGSRPAPAAAHSTGAARTGSHLSTPLVVLLQALAIVVVLVATGAVAGVLWNHLWNPPTGEVQSGVWGVYTEAGLRADFAGVALYVVIAVAAGLLTGALTGLVLDRAELVSLVVLLGSAALAGWVMWKIGVHRSPPDPQRLAAGLADGTVLPGHLRLHGRTPFISWPIGSLVGFALVLVVLPKRGAGRPDPAADGPPDQASGQPSDQSSGSLGAGTFPPQAGG